MRNPTAIFLLFLSLGIFYTFTNPQYQALAGLRMEAVEYRDILGNLERLEETRGELVSKYKSFPKVEEERLTKVLPDSLDTVGLAHELDSIAGLHGATIKDLSVEGDKGQAIAAGQMSGPVGKESVTVSFVANYANFRQILADLEQSLRIADVRGITFKPTENGLYEYEVRLDVYWLE